jgi:FkbM family methyltransferase
LNLEYDYPYQNNPKVIFDLGANIGDTAIFYSILFPEALVYAIEPNSFIFDKLKKNTKQFPNITCFQCAIGGTTGKIKLNLSESHLGSSLLYRVQNTKEIKVDVLTLGDFCIQQKVDKIDILKFDIEGAEEYLLQTKNLELLVGSIVGEIHNDLSQVDLDSLINRLNLKNSKKKFLSEKRYIIYGTL